MKYFLVFQRTFKEEYTKSYLWAPQKKKDGTAACFYWENMTKVKKGDVIFSVSNQKIVSVNIAEMDCIEAKRPEELWEQWNKEGWLVKAKYNILNSPISVKENKNEILSKCPEKYSPYNKNGNGAQGYLFELSEDLSNVFKKIINKKNGANFVDNLIIDYEKDDAYIKGVENDVPEDVTETEKEIIIKARVGQGKFRGELIGRTACCEICGMNIMDMLYASHCKPWKVASSSERLDRDNGLLLCSCHDSLFDKGYITFEENGEISVSSLLDDEQRKLLNIDKEYHIEFNEKQKQYIKYHRENIFKE